MKRLGWFARNLDGVKPKPKKGILFLPGRGGIGSQMIEKYEKVFEFPGVALMSVTPIPTDGGWYPMPNGPGDQRDAVAGLDFAAAQIENTLDVIEDNYGIKRSNIILSGFSAGAVTALHFLSQTLSPPAGVVCHGGAILAPHRLPPCPHPDVPIVLNHAYDDYCFDWYERYLPMKLALRREGYRIRLLERDFGNHVVLEWDIVRLKKFINKTLNVNLESLSKQSRD